MPGFLHRESKTEASPEARREAARQRTIAVHEAQMKALQEAKLRQAAQNKVDAINAAE